MVADRGYPRTGRKANCLGVVLPPDAPADIEPNDEGVVDSGMGGMSVAPEIHRLPGRLIPSRLRSHYPKATGSDALVVFVCGEGEFVRGSFASGLLLRPDPKRPGGHGFIEPNSKMTLADYENALYATQSDWKNGE